MNNLLKNIIPKTVFTLLIVAGSFTLLEAQRADRSVGIGAQFGQPTGLTLKFYNATGMSTDILAAWDLDDFFFVNVHGLWERHLGNSGRFHYFVGPGVFAGIRENGREGTSSNDFSAGLSGTLGLNVILGRVEIFGQVTPRLQLIDETNGAVGGGAGLRFYFK